MKKTIEIAQGQGDATALYELEDKGKGVIQALDVQRRSVEITFLPEVDEQAADRFVASLTFVKRN